VIAEEIAVLGDVGVVYLLGGEPTLHPRFDDLARMARSVRGSGLLMLATNGSGLGNVRKSIKYFDDMLINPSDKSHIDLGGGEIPCGRIMGTVSVHEGRVYPCCVACGIADCESINLSPGWERRILDVEAPCERCVFGTKQE
jgi:hypothetical protein